MAITPGNDTILTMKNSLAGGRPAGFATMVGIICGCAVHASFSALGISMVLVRSAELFEIVKMAGAAYLIFLGVKGLWTLWQSRRAESSATPIATLNSKTVHRAFIEGLMTNILNPKVAVFYLSFLPQFINPNDGVMARSFLLASIHQVVGSIWLSAIVLFVTRVQGVLTRSSIRRKLEAATSMVLIAFGLKLALEKR